MYFRCKSPIELKSIALELLPEILNYKNVCFVAPMGAGKTTLIKQICVALGVTETDIHSPTYSLINEYHGTSNTIFHFDFYRLNSIEEAFDFGLEEYFGRDAICLMEWPKIVAPILPMPCLKIEINIEEEDRILNTQIINFL